MKTKITYNATGLVFGETWPNGWGGYKATPLTEYKSIKELLSQANKMLEDGSLDSGFGFIYGLDGAILNIEKIEVITKDGKEYINEKYLSTVNIGEVTPEQEEIFYETL